jgi:hypothetical protein
MHKARISVKRHPSVPVPVPVPRFINANTKNFEKEDLNIACLARLHHSCYPHKAAQY